MTTTTKQAPDLFDDHLSVNFEAMPEDFQRYLRRFVIHVDTRGGIPAASTVDSQGVPIGKWYASLVACPHLLTIEQRATLLAIPGVQFYPTRGGFTPLSATSSARTTLWNRLRAWARDPMSDPVSKRFIDGRAARRAFMERRAAEKEK